MMQAQIQAQKELARMSGDDSMKMYAPQLQERLQENQAVVIAEVNPSKVVAEMLLEFSGKEVVDGKVKTVGEPLLNERGLRVLRLNMKTVLNQSNTLSHLKDEEIKRILLNFSNNLAKDFALNWREYGVRDLAVCDAIMDTLIINSYTVLKRSQEQNEKNWLGRISFESINHGQQAPKKKKGGFLEKFKL